VIAVDAACITALRGNCRPAILTNLALAAILAAVVWPAVPHPLVAGWLGMVIAANLVRWLLVTRFPTSEVPVAGFLTWARNYTAATGIAGALWGFAAYTFLIPDNITVQFFLIVTLLGICTGAVSGLASWQPALLAFIAPALAPFVVALLATGSTPQLVLAAMAILFFVMLWITGRNINRTLRGSFEAQFRSEALASALLTAKEAADTANRSKSRFLSSMSHELRTPLNAILGFTDLLTLHPSETVSDQQRTYIGNIEHAGRHLLSLINQVLNLAEIESGNIELDWRQVDPSPIIDESFAILAPLATKHAVTLQGFSEPAPAVLGDATRLKQVLLNLLSNAIKYNRLGGSVTLSWEDRPDGRLRINVTDTGFGIRDDKKRELFIPFARLGVEASNIEGSGIGLTICRQLMDIMGGRIGFETAADEGSSFWIELPRAEP